MDDVAISFLSVLRAKKFYQGEQMRVSTTERLWYCYFYLVNSFMCLFFAAKPCIPVEALLILSNIFCCRCYTDCV